MSNGEITAEIERFIHDNINSVEQLEILLLLAGAPQKQWSVLEVSQKLYRQAESVTMRLQDLRDRGIVVVCGEAPLLFCYRPGAAKHALIQGLERAYQVRKDAVIHLIFTRPPDNLRVFSDAFRIRRND